MAPLASGIASKTSQPPGCGKALRAKRKKKRKKPVSFVGERITEKKTKVRARRGRKAGAPKNEKSPDVLPLGYRRKDCVTSKPVREKSPAETQKETGERSTTPGSGDGKTSFRNTRRPKKQSRHTKMKSSGQPTRTKPDTQQNRVTESESGPGRKKKTLGPERRRDGLGEAKLKGQVEVAAEKTGTSKRAQLYLPQFTCTTRNGQGIGAV